MSAKYERVKQADILLPAPLRWLTRAFSSITLAVTLLTVVAVYGALASVPLVMLLLFAIWLAQFVVTVGLTTIVGYRVAAARFAWAANMPLVLRLLFALILLAMGVAAFVIAALATQTAVTSQQWYHLYRATVIYRLPYFELTELEFFSWWPMKLVLFLFVLNMVWATIRRIEFRFVNIGVLTVHVGIVVITLGSIFYGKFKVEGDTIIWRADLQGEPVMHFYDQTMPAAYLTHNQRTLMIPLESLPRYNDYAIGELNIRLDEHPEAREQFVEMFGPDMKATVRGFVSYGKIEERWMDASEYNGPVAPLWSSPAIMMGYGDSKQVRVPFPQPLLAAVPGLRVHDEPGWAVEYLVEPGTKRLADLSASFSGEHGLVVEVPDNEPNGKPFRQVYSITPGQVIQVGDTGFTLTIESIGPYGMPFATRGYEGATDTRAQVRIERAGAMFRRIALHRYPERSQDFVPAPPGTPGVGPMGRRTDPNPSIDLTYIDASKTQFRVIADTLDSPQLRLLARTPGHAPVYLPIEQDRFGVTSPDGVEVYFHITRRIASAVQVPEPVPMEKSLRQPKDEGTYLHAMLPVDLEKKLPDGSTWTGRVWLTHMRYPMYPDDVKKPETLDVPGLGPVKLAFSRTRMPLPFAMRLDSFEMIPYAGTQIPRDFASTLAILPLGPDRLPLGQPQHLRTHMNNPVLFVNPAAPVVYRRLKLSQVAWDPGNENDPNRTRKDAQGRFTNQQRYSIIGVGNNVGIRVIFVGACLVTAGIPWAFYIKPLLMQRRKRLLQQQLREQQADNREPNVSVQSTAQSTIDTRSRATT